MSVCCATSPSIIPTAPTVCLSTRKSVALSVRPTSPSDHLYTILSRPSGCHTSSDRVSTIYTHSSAHLPPSHHLYDTPISLSACPSPSDCLTATTTRPPVRPSSPLIHCTQDSIHSLAVVNGINRTRFTIHKIRSNP